MTPRTLLRLAGAAAVIGGALRIAATLAPWLPDPVLIQGAYLTVDVFLLLGLVGLYAEGAGRLGWIGLVGFVTALIGICVVRSQASFVPDGYVAGAALTGIGTAILGGRMLAERGRPKLGPALWIAALAIGGIGPMLVGAAGAGAVAGVVFGLAFILAGAALARQEAAP